MKRENKLIEKVKLLLKRAKAPRFLHWFGPKLYELWQHVFALFVKGSAQLSFRRTTQFLREFGFVVATKVRCSVTLQNLVCLFGKLYFGQLSVV